MKILDEICDAIRALIAIVFLIAAFVVFAVPALVVAGVFLISAIICACVVAIATVIAGLLMLVGIVVTPRGLKSCIAAYKECK